MNRPILSFVIALLLISDGRQVQAQNYTYLGAPILRAGNPIIWLLPETASALFLEN
ncbi:MAG: hypothetical protein RI983_492 [Bacteroidota bacterium]|jgi:hypothetical protein